MDRIIGIDYGRKRVGVAVSDPLGIFASALETVQSAKIIEYLKKYAENENVVLFVVGYPINMNGAPSEAAHDVDIFLKHLAKAFPDVPVHLEDERSDRSECYDGEYRSAHEHDRTHNRHEESGACESQ